MEELRELYQQVILDHNRDPRNFGTLESCTHDSEGFNPLCGDRVHIYLIVENDVISDIRFDGAGCAISKASASVMTGILKGQTLEHVRALFSEFQALITSELTDEPDIEALGKLAVFAGVREFPSRVKCASLAWHTLLAAVENSDSVVSTE